MASVHVVFFSVGTMEFVDLPSAAALLGVDWSCHLSVTACKDFHFSEDDVLSFLRRSTMGVFPSWTDVEEPSRFASGVLADRLHWVLDRTDAHTSQHLALGDPRCRERSVVNPRRKEAYTWASGNMPTSYTLAFDALSVHLEHRMSMDDATAVGTELFASDINTTVEEQCFPPELTKALYFYREPRLTLMFCLAPVWYSNREEYGWPPPAVEPSFGPFKLLHRHEGYTRACEEVHCWHRPLNDLEDYEEYVMDRQATRYDERNLSVYAPGHHFAWAIGPFLGIKDLRRVSCVSMTYKHAFKDYWKNRAELQEFMLDFLERQHEKQEKRVRDVEARNEILEAKLLELGVDPDSL